jgi:hypothetical protein
LLRREILFIFKKKRIFATDLVTQRTDFFCCNGIRECYLGVKRESGENPEQSRCCELAENLRWYLPLQPSKEKTTVRRHSRMGRSRVVGSKSEDLPSHDFKAFEERAEELKIEN